MSTPSRAATQCLVYLPHSYNARGPAESCASLLPGFEAKDLAATVFVPRLKRPFTAQVRVVETMPPLMRQLPFAVSAPLAWRSLEARFISALKKADPLTTIAYFWPDVPLRVLRSAKAAGIMSVREMINNPVEVAKGILDRAYADFGAPADHGASQQKLEHEREELPLYDFLFAPNVAVEESLDAIGIDRSRVMPTSWGWRADRFTSQGARVVRPAGGPIRALFVGTIEIRKGVPELLAAWRDADVDGTLLLAGSVAPELRKLVDEHLAGGKVEHLGFVEDVAALYRSADFFVFPTHEEGGPQVTVEAGGCGLPAIVTPMGAARIVEDGENGIIVPPGDVAALTRAIRRLSLNLEERQRMARNAFAKGRSYEYFDVGARRAELLLEAHAKHLARRA